MVLAPAALARLDRATLAAAAATIMAAAAAAAARLGQLPLTIPHRELVAAALAVLAVLVEAVSFTRAAAAARLPGLAA
jgi:hypothetical protein